ncbi:secreted RxLR effector protein 161-like [Lathyrus oleraceus]|uniref:secreted RxLR effector protein 161-like n=1 Tax=Pisum sativum TaxID=3888 RepID=UPI0021D33C4C|nr:secreted RxLR effector protein 161-like [Pisum sativum]
MEDCNGTLTSAEPRLQLTKDPNEDKVDANQYRKLIVSLRYICHTRLDLAHSVGTMSRFMKKPKVSHLLGIKRILRCLKGTLDYDIFFPATDEGKECKLVGYIDSSWCGDAKDKKSITGYVFMLGGAPVAWSSENSQL